MSGIDLSAVVNGALVSAVAVIGRWVAAAARKPRGHAAEDLSIARWFESYRLTDRLPELPGIPYIVEQRLVEMLPSDEVQVTLQELLAVRLTDAAEVYAVQAREAFLLTFKAVEQRAGPEHLALFAEKLGGYYDDRICELVARLEGAEPLMLAQVRAEAFSARMIAVLHAIERHTAALAPGASGYRAETDFLARYSRHVNGHHGMLQPPDFDRRRLVPIGDIYVPGRVYEHSSGEGAVSSAPERPDLLDMAEFAARIDQTVLLGDPGGGKTTTAKFLMCHFNRRTDSVPFLVTLREYAAADPPQRSVVGHVENELATFYQCPAPPGLIDRLLLTGRGVVIFDGLDELLDTSRRAEVTARVERFCGEYPLARVLITSRLIGYDQARLDDRQFTPYRLGGFTDADVRAYAEKWFAQEEDARPGEARAFLAESEAVPDLRSNPLLLSLMCILYRGEGSLPRDRAGIYEACATLLFRRWDARRRIHADVRAEHLLEPALRHIAWWLYAEPDARPAVTERAIVGKTAEFFRIRGFENPDTALEAAREFVAFCRGRLWVFTDTGTTSGGEKLYAFAHRTFLEYFAAAQLAYDSDTPERLARTLAPRVARSEWGVVSELAVQIKDATSTEGARRVYAELIGERRRRSAEGRSGVLQFLARTLRSADPSPSLVRELTREIIQFLYAGDPDSDVRGLPVAWLLASCEPCQDLVDEEISAWITATAQSQEPEQRLTSLRLASSLDVPLRGSWRGLGADLPRSSRQRGYWEKRAAENVSAYSTAIIELAHHSDMLYLALRHDLITVEQALNITGDLSLLIQRHVMNIFGLSYGPYLLTSFHLVAVGSSENPLSLSKWITALEDAGRYLTLRSEPPWASGRIDKWSAYSWRQPHSTDLLPPELSPLAYLGAAGTLLISAESDNANPAVTLDGDASRLGPFSNLYPYLQRRRQPAGPSLPLPDLPVPDEFRQVFKDWAEGRVNLNTPEN